MLKISLKREKKEKKKRVKHNLMVILKSLAKDEYQKTNNKRLYEKRLKDITNGKLPYSPEKVAEKKEQLETLALFSEEDIPEDERIYSTIDYIDSTLDNRLYVTESAVEFDDNGEFRCVAISQKEGSAYNVKAGEICNLPVKYADIISVINEAD